MFLRKAILTFTFLMQLCIGGSTLAQTTTQPPPFGDKHVGGDVPIDERFKKAPGRNAVPAEDRVLTNGPLAPSKEDRMAFAWFLRNPDTGLIRLLQPGKVPLRPGLTAMSGSGAFYSFANLTHLSRYGSDISLSLDQLSVNFMSGYGFMTNLGNVPLEGVMLTDQHAGFIAAYEPAITLLQARAETLRFRQAVVIEGKSYQARLPVELNSTYIVRSINYGQPLFGPNSSSGISAEGRRTDVLVAFRAVRKDADGNLTIVWKLLKKYPEPKLD